MMTMLNPGLSNIASLATHFGFRVELIDYAAARMLKTKTKKTTPVAPAPAPAPAPPPVDASPSPFKPMSPQGWTRGGAAPPAGRGRLFEGVFGGRAGVVAVI